MWRDGGGVVAGVAAGKGEVESREGELSRGQVIGLGKERRR